MNVHLIRSEELDQETYWNVLDMLRQFPGELKFIACEDPVVPKDVDTVVWKDDEEFDKKNKLRFSKSEQSVQAEAVQFPYEEKIISWEDIFSLCNQYRVKKDIGKEEFVFLLTDIANYNNWFSSASENSLDGFIHTAHWEHYFPGTDSRFPITYLIATLIIQQLMYDNYIELMENVHNKPIGCMMDFCGEKKQIMHKMRTADICHKCLDHMKVENIPAGIIFHVMRIMSGVREQMLFKERAELFSQPGKIELRGHMQKIFLTDFGDLEVRLTPLERTLYLLFLNHPEGIQLNSLYDHEEEVSTIYSQISNRGNLAEIQQSIDHLVDPTENSASEKISKIKKKFENAVGEKSPTNHPLIMLSR